MRLTIAAVALVLAARPASAQVIPAGGFARQAAFGFSHTGHHVRAGGFAAYGYAGGAVAVRPWGWFAAPVVVVPPPLVVLVPAYDLQGYVEPPPRTPEPDRARWHVIRPLKQPAFPLVARPDLIHGAPPAAAGERKPNPKDEAARQVRLAQAAFAAEEYGRAVERLDEAIKAQPKEPLPRFLLAQVRFARGEYAEAVAAVRDGLALAPDWPATDFTPKPLYAGAPARFDEQLKDLRRAAADRPDDVTVQFLLGYQLWFNGERGEATRLFRRLAPAVKERNLIDAFLDVAVGRVVRK